MGSAPTVSSLTAKLELTNSSCSKAPGNDPPLTLEPFIPASHSTRKESGARRQRGPRLHELYKDYALLTPNIPDYDRFYTIVSNSGENLSELDVIRANRELRDCLGGSPKKLTELRSAG